MNMKAFFTILLVVLLVGCEALKTGGVTFSGGDGSSFEQAVIISGASGESSGIRAEHVWLREHYPGCKLTFQSLRGASGRAYDKMDIVTIDGQPQSIYFDITSFFGR
jgi:hypothetical protein